jgi:enoyl-CoA hydratase
MTTEYATIRYETTDTGIARVTLAMPEKRNAQTLELLSEFNDALDKAAQDDDVKVIVIAADGDHFSSGHAGPGNLDLKEYETQGSWSISQGEGAERHWGFEQEFFLGYCWRWRNIPKPTMVEVQGWVIAGGLMLVWPFDIIIAADDTKFTDPVVALGVNGVEYFAHPWEFGTRKAKEMLYTGEVITAEEAKSLGMVNHVVTREELTDFTMAMAENIARRPMMGLKLAKQSVNQAEEAQGLYSALQSAMSLQQLGHSHWRHLNENDAAVYLEGGALMKEIFDKYKKPKKAE